MNTCMICKMMKNPSGFLTAYGSGNGHGGGGTAKPQGVLMLEGGGGGGGGGGSTWESALACPECQSRPVQCTWTLGGRNLSEENTSTNRSAGPEFSEEQTFLSCQPEHTSEDQE